MSLVKDLNKILRKKQKKTVISKRYAEMALQIEKICPSAPTKPQSAVIPYGGYQEQGEVVYRRTTHKKYSG